jgi:hypothetical protein
VLEFVLGDYFRMSTEEAEHLYRSDGEYTLNAFKPLEAHQRAAEMLFRETFRADRLKLLEEHAAQASVSSNNRAAGGAAASDGTSHDTLHILQVLTGLADAAAASGGDGGGAGSAGRASPTLFGFLAEGTSDAAVMAAMEAGSRDQFACQVRWALVEAIMVLKTKTSGAWGKAAWQIVGQR